MPEPLNPYEKVWTFVIIIKKFIKKEELNKIEKFKKKTKVKVVGGKSLRLFRS